MWSVLTRLLLPRLLILTFSSQPRPAGGARPRAGAGLEPSPLRYGGGAELLPNCRLGQPLNGCRGRGAAVTRRRWVRREREGPGVRGWRSRGCSPRAGGDSGPAEALGLNPRHTLCVFPAGLAGGSAGDHGVWRSEAASMLNVTGVNSVRCPLVPGSAPVPRPL